MSGTRSQPPAAGEAAHTPIYQLVNTGRGWELQMSVEMDDVKIWRGIANFPAVHFESAQSVLRACNSHAPMMAALESALVILDIECAGGFKDDDTPNTRARDKVRAALNSAKGVQS